MKTEIKDHAAMEFFQTLVSPNFSQGACEII